MSRKILSVITAVVVALAVFMSVEPASAATQTKYITADVLNVRSGAGTNHKVVTKVRKGQAVSVTSVRGSWSRVAANNKVGWVSSQHLAARTTTDVVNGFRTVGANKQLVLVTTNGTTTTSADIKTFEKDPKGRWVQKMSVKGHVGKKGVGKAREGDSKTPVGKYTITTTFGQKGNPGTKMPFKRITSDDVWIDDSSSRLYNTWQSRSKTRGQWKSAESMNNRLYTHGFVIDYNTSRVKGAGSAIFFHIGSSYTLGCVATSESNVKSVMRWLDPSKSPVIVISPVQHLGKY